jgi:hypothetical protein
MKTAYRQRVNAALKRALPAQSLAEYAILIALVGIVSIGSLVAMGDGLSLTLNNMDGAQRGRGATGATGTPSFRSSSGP